VMSTSLATAYLDARGGKKVARLRADCAISFPLLTAVY
jgi:hypothetical protein